MSIYLVGIVVSGLFYVVTYLATNDFMVATIPACLALVYFLLIASPQVASYQKKTKFFKLTNQFVNNFIVSLSIQPVIDNAFSSAIASLNYDFKDKLHGTEELTSLEKLKHLGNYFTFHAYQAFVQVVDLWQEQGGDILKMSNFLTNQFREIEEYILTCKQIAEKKIIEFSMLWVFALSILVVIRFALSQFYSLIVTNKVYLVGVLAIFAFALFSCQILISKVCSIDLKGWKKYGK